MNGCDTPSAQVTAVGLQVCAAARDRLGDLVAGHVREAVQVDGDRDAARLPVLRDAAVRARPDVAARRRRQRDDHRHRQQRQARDAGCADAPRQRRRRRRARHEQRRRDEGDETGGRRRRRRPSRTTSSRRRRASPAASTSSDPAPPGRSRTPPAGRRARACACRCRPDWPTGTSSWRERPADASLQSGIGVAVSRRAGPARWK